MEDPVDAIAGSWDSIGLGVDTSPLRIVARMQRLVARWDAELRPPFAGAGLAAGDFDVLAALRRSAEPMSPSGLAQAVLVTAGATTKRVDRLIAASLAVRTRSADDGRGRLVTLTDEGVEMADRLMRQHLVTEAGLLASLDAGEREVLERLLARLLADAESRTSTTRPEKE